MAVLEHQIVLPRGRLSVGRLSLPLLVAVAALALVAGGIVIRGFAENGFRLGSQLGWRFTLMMFFFLLVGAPAARLMARFRRTPDSERLSRDLVWSFCASYGVYLASVLLPNLAGGEDETGTLLFTVFGAVVTAVMALLADPATARWAGKGARRAMMGMGVIFFWSAYTVMALAHMSGPHRPDSFFGFSLCLMLVGLLVRFADRMVAAPQPSRDAQAV